MKKIIYLIAAVFLLVGYSNHSYSALTTQTKELTIVYQDPIRCTTGSSLGNPALSGVMVACSSNFNKRTVGATQRKKYNGQLEQFDSSKTLYIPIEYILTKADIKSFFIEKTDHSFQQFSLDPPLAPTNIYGNSADFPFLVLQTFLYFRKVNPEFNSVKERCLHFTDKEDIKTSLHSLFENTEIHAGLTHQLCCPRPLACDIDPVLINTDGSRIENPLLKATEERTELLSRRNQAQEEIIEQLNKRIEVLKSNVELLTKAIGEQENENQRLSTLYKQASDFNLELQAQKIKDDQKKNKSLEEEKRKNLENIEILKQELATLKSTLENFSNTQLPESEPLSKPTPLDELTSNKPKEVESLEILLKNTQKQLFIAKILGCFSLIGLFLYIIQCNHRAA